MIGLGIDLCEVSRIEKQLLRGEGFLNRYYTPLERKYLDERGQGRGQSAAGMYAAKEAALKAFGCGLTGGIALGEIEIEHTILGAPEYRFTGEALAKFERIGAKRAHLSITHDGGMAAAVCVLE